MFPPPPQGDTQLCPPPVVSPPVPPHNFDPPYFRANRGPHISPPVKFYTHWGIFFRGSPFVIINLPPFYPGPPEIFNVSQSPPSVERGFSGPWFLGVPLAPLEPPPFHWPFLGNPFFNRSFHPRFNSPEAPYCSGVSRVFIISPPFLIRFGIVGI